MNLKPKILITSYESSRTRTCNLQGMSLTGYQLPHTFLKIENYYSITFQVAKIVSILPIIGSKIKKKAK